MHNREQLQRTSYLPEYGQFDPPPIFALKMFYFDFILNSLSKYNDFTAKFVTIVIVIHTSGTTAG